MYTCEKTFERISDCHNTKDRKEQKLGDESSTQGKEELICFEESYPLRLICFTIAFHPHCNPGIHTSKNPSDRDPC